MSPSDVYDPVEATAVAINGKVVTLTFDDFRERDLQPAYLADADLSRAILDQRVVCDLLSFDRSVYEGVRRLAAKWCAEPSVHGGKARPPDAALVI